MINKEIPFFNNDNPTEMYGISRIENYNNYATDEEFDKYYKNNNTEFNYQYVIYGCCFEHDEPVRQRTRRYLQPQDVFSEVNGFFPVLLFFLRIIFSFYSKYEFDFFVYSHLVDLIETDKDNKMNTSNKNIEKQFLTIKKDPDPKNEIDGIHTIYHYRLPSQCTEQNDPDPISAKSPEKSNKPYNLRESNEIFEENHNENQKAAHGNYREENKFQRAPTQEFKNDQIKKFKKILSDAKKKDPKYKDSENKDPKNKDPENKDTNKKEPHNKSFKTFCIYYGCSKKKIRKINLNYRIFI